MGGGGGGGGPGSGGPAGGGGWPSRLYTAWCAAAIVLPITAGRLFDLTQGYGVAVLIAAGANALGVLVALGLPRQDAPRAAHPDA